MLFATSDLLTFSPVIGSALTVIYRELQQLDAGLIARNMDGSYQMSATSNSTWPKPNQQADGIRPLEGSWMNSNDIAFAVPNFDDYEIPADFFSMLPELEPISANVGAGFDIDLDKPWY